MTDSTPASGASHADGVDLVMRHNPQTPPDTEAPGGTVDPTLRACQWAGPRNPGSAPGLATTGAPQRPPIRGDAQGWESSHSGPGRGQVLAGGDGLKGRSLLPRPDGKGGRPLAAERSTSASPRRRQHMCSGCPFNPDRDWPKISADVMETIEARIAAGEAWICHQTCDGARVTPRSLLCAGTP